MRLCSVVAGRLFIVVSTVSMRMISYFIVLGAEFFDACLIGFVSQLSTVANVAVRVGSVLRYLPQFPVDEYISICVPHLHARRFALTSIGQTLKNNVGNKARELIWLMQGEGGSETLGRSPQRDWLYARRFYRLLICAFCRIGGLLSKS